MSKSKSIRQNVRKGIDNIRMWREIRYGSVYPTIGFVLGKYDNEWILNGMKNMVNGDFENHFEYEHMETEDLITELNRLRSLKRYNNNK